MTVKFDPARLSEGLIVSPYRICRDLLKDVLLYPWFDTVRFILGKKVVFCVKHRTGSPDIHLCIGTANRATRRFANHYRRNSARRLDHDLDFGGGAHTCIGIVLTRYGEAHRHW